MSLKAENSRNEICGEIKNNQTNANESINQPTNQNKGQEASQTLCGYSGSAEILDENSSISRWFAYETIDLANSFMVMVSLSSTSKLKNSSFRTSSCRRVRKE